MVDTEKYTINGTMEKTGPEYKNNAVVTDKFLLTDLDEYVSFCGRVRADRQYRCRLLHTACTTWAMVSFGITQTMIGLAFPDLMLIINKDVADASWIFTTWSFGNMIGSMLAGYLYDRLNKLAVLISLSLGLAITTSITPWCSFFPLMLIVHLIGGGFSSAIHSTVTADTIYLWQKEKATILQIVHLAGASGGIVSPLFVNPFLTKQTEEAIDGNISNMTTSGMYHKQISNMSLLNTTNGAFGYGNNYDNNSVYIPDEAVEMYGDGTRIHYTYILSACFTFMAVISYLLTCLTHGNVYFQQGHKKEVVTNSKSGNNKLPKSTVAMFVFVVAVQIMVYLTSQRHLFGFFMTYAINKLEWTKRATSSILLGFWIIFGLSRITVLLALRKIKEENLNWTYICIASLGTIGLTLSAQSNVSILVVICLYISGFGNAPILSFMWSWFSSNITLVTGRITGLVYVSIATGCMTVPVLSGYLMNNLSYDWFLYLYLALSVLYVGLTVFIRVLYKKVKHSK